MTYSIGAIINVDAISDTIDRAICLPPRNGACLDLNKTTLTEKIAMRAGHATRVANDL